MHTPAEHAAMKKAIFRPGIDSREYQARHREADAVAVDMICQWAKTLNGVAAIRLLDIAATLINGPERDIIIAASELMCTTDPEDMESAADDLRDAATGYVEHYTPDGPPLWDDDRSPDLDD